MDLKNEYFKTISFTYISLEVFGHIFKENNKWINFSDLIFLIIEELFEY